MVRPLKIALLHPSLAVAGGAERACLWLADELVRRGHRVTVITQDHDSALYGDLSQKKYSLEFFPFGRSEAEIDLAGRTAKARELALTLKGFDLIDPHNFPAYLWAVWAKEQDPSLAPIVWYCEEPFRRLYEKEMQEKYRPWLETPAPVVPERPTLWSRIRRLLGRIKRGLDPRLRGDDIRRGDDKNIKDAALAASTGTVVDQAAAGKRSDQAEEIKKLDKAAVARLDLILANSAFTAGQVKKVYDRDAQTCLLGCPPLDPAGRKAKPSAEAPYFLTATRLFPIKNIKRAVEAVGRLKEQGRLGAWRYFIAGDGDKVHRQQLLEMISKLRLDQVVVLKNFVSEKRLAVLMAGAGFVLCPSLEEPFGLVPLEAASAGRPAIVSDHGGYAETVVHERTGLLVDPFDVEQMASAIARLCSEAELRERLGRQARERYQKEFTVAKFVDRWQALIDRRWPLFF